MMKMEVFIILLMERRIIDGQYRNTPLLLLDNSNMMSVLNHGEPKCTDLSFEEDTSHH